MLRSSGDSSQRLLILFISGFVVLIIITVFISYSTEVAKEARINMLKISQMQLKSANRMLLSRATISNLQFHKKLDASVLDDAYQGGVLTYGELSAVKANIPIFINVDKLIIKENSANNAIKFYPEGMQDKACYLIYIPPQIETNKLGQQKRIDAQYQLSVEQC